MNEENEAKLLNFIRKEMNYCITQLTDNPDVHTRAMQSKVRAYKMIEAFIAEGYNRPKEMLW